MIQVAGRPFSLESTTDFGRVERAILQQMLDSSEWFSYSSMNELRFELNVRINIMESAKEMNASQVTFTIFEHASCNPEYWTLTSTGGFLVRSDVRPSDAILDIYRNGTLYGFECATAIIIIYYQAILKSIGQLRFDSIFQHLYLYSWHTHPGLELHTFHADRFLPGDVVYFNNPDFSSRHTMVSRGKRRCVERWNVFWPRIWYHDGGADDTIVKFVSISGEYATRIFSQFNHKNFSSNDSKSFNATK